MRRRGILAAMLAWSAVALAASTAHAERLAVFKSRDLPPYDEAIQGLTEELVGWTIDVHDMKGDVDGSRDAYESLRAQRPDAFVAVGTLALRLLREEQEIPVVFTMVGRPERHFEEGQGNLTGVSLDADPKQQFAHLRRLVPNARAVGVLYDAASSQEELDAAVDAAEAEGFELMPVSVDSAKDIPRTLKSVRKSIDALWLLPNRKALTSRSLEYVVEEMTKQRTPIMAASARYTRAGALFSLDVSYAQVGMQTGRLIRRAIESASAAHHPTELPSRYSLTLNMKTADLLGLPVSPEVRDSAASLIQ